jgi:hypothetical protein
MMHHSLSFKCSPHSAFHCGVSSFIALRLPFWEGAEKKPVRRPLVEVPSLHTEDKRAVSSHLVLYPFTLASATIYSLKEILSQNFPAEAFLNGGP